MLGHNKRLERKLKESGTQSWAVVLESEQQWASSGGTNVAVGQAGSMTIHQKLKLRVEPDGEPPFEATIKQVYNDTKGPHIPQEGWSVKVLYDPGDHSKLVIDMDAMPVRPGADRDEAVARHERALARMQDPEAWRQRVADAQANAAAQIQNAAAMREAMAGAAPQSQAPSSGPDVADELEKLADLRDRGVLTDAEFEVQKARLLGSG